MVSFEITPLPEAAIIDSIILKSMLPKLSDYKDLITKLDYDLKRVQETNHIYDLLNCLLTLNSLPEWIIKSDTASENLKKIAEEKVMIMRGTNGFNLDQNSLFDNIDHQLRFIRLICNHTKHKTDSKQIPVIQSVPGTGFPMMFPARFSLIVAIGDLRVDGEFLAYHVSEFWKKETLK